MKPVYISGEVALNNRDIKTPDNSSISLANPFTAPMWVDRINFTFNDSMAGVIYCELKLGNEPLTDGFVPVDLLTEPQEFSVQRGMISSPWVLSRPIYVPENGYIQPRFYHSGLGSVAPVTARITYIGRAFEPGDARPDPEDLWLPYISSYIATARVGGSNYADKSSESNLRNPFAQPLDVVCLRGRIGLGNDIASDASAFQSTQVRGVNQDSAVVLRDSSEFFALFGDGFWRTRFRLPGNGFLVMTLTENYSALSALNTYRPRFSMVGYRQV